MNTYGVLTSLDSIFDTRLSIAYAIDNIISIENWVRRKEEGNDTISTELFYKMYENRNTNILRKSHLAECVNLLNEITFEARVEDLENGGNGVIPLYVDISVYDLNQKDMEKIKNILGGYINDYSYIEFVDNKNISSNWIDSKIGVIIMHDGLKWLEKLFVKENVFNQSFKDVGLITNVNEIDEIISNSLQNFITLHQVDLNVFSIKEKTD